MTARGCENTQPCVGSAIVTDHRSTERLVQYVPVKQEKILSRINAEVRHLSKTIQLPALSRYSSELRRDAQKEEPIAHSRVGKATIVLFQKREHASGDGGGEIASSRVCYDAAAGPCDFPPSSLMLAQPLESFRCSLTEHDRQVILHATGGQRDCVL